MIKDCIGGYKYETNKSVVDVKLVQDMTDVKNIAMCSSKEVKINDEYDNKEFKEVFDNNDRTMILGIYPGVGKTTCVKNYEDHNILFISPYNKLCQELQKNGFVALTLNKLLGFFGDNNDYTTKKH